MIILGINDGHHASAAILVDGVLKAALSEERFTRRKGEHGYPRQAISACLRITGLTAQDIDKVAIATRDLPPIYFMIRRDSDFGVGDYWREQFEYWHPKLYEKKNVNYLEVFKDKIDPNGFEYDQSLLKDVFDQEGMQKARIKFASEDLNLSEDCFSFYDHHACHAYYGLLAVPDKRRPYIVFTADGFGDGANGSVWSYTDSGRPELLCQTDKCHIGRMYRYATLLLGMKPAEHEFKVMGLAPYANERYGQAAYQVYADTLQVDGLDFTYKIQPPDNFFYFREKLGGARFDAIAYGIQRRTEELVTEWVSNGVNQTGFSDIIFSGGVAQNIKANKCVWELPSVNSLFVPPGPHDESLSIGASYMAFMETDLPDAGPMGFSNAYLGTCYSDEEIGAHLSKYDHQSGYTYRRASEEDVAALLADNEVVARVNGRMEFGARALGARSINANPSNKNVVKQINDLVKVRDFWMPFAPSILEERVSDYIVNPKGIDSRYMTVGFDSTPLAQAEIPAALHPYDYTARPNVVRQSDNPSYHALIRAFEKKTGIGALLNTSYNLHGEPVVESPKDATSTFERCGLRHLSIGGWLLSKVS